jgi:flagellar hook-associated protein 1 FlgK
MALLNVFQSGKSGMTTAKAGIATAGHNISNANTEGFSRQRIQSEANVTQQTAGHGGPYVGNGSKVSSIDRINDQYLEKQLREGTRDLSYHEEKQVALNQVEDVFNEMNGDGLNRMMSKFFNDFRKLSNDPTSEAVRQSVRESSQSMIGDFKRLHSETDAIRAHVDSRIDGYMKELNQYADEVKELNVRIHQAELQENSANDLQDRRDMVLKKMSGLVDLSVHKETSNGMVTVEIKGVGPIVTGPTADRFFVNRAPADPDSGSPVNSLQITRSPYSNEHITSQFQGGKIGALIEARDKTIGGTMDKLDQLAFSVATAVNEIHSQGYTLDGQTGINFFKDIDSATGAAQRLALSDHVLNSTANIASGLQPESPGDNRNALAIANLQNGRFLNGGKTTVDDFYNSIVSDIGVTNSRNTESLAQTKNILTQLEKVREQVSGVSIDEETTNLMQFQHAFDASARVIKVADEMLDTVLKLRG